MLFVILIHGTCTLCFCNVLYGRTIKQIVFNDINIYWCYSTYRVKIRFNFGSRDGCTLLHFGFFYQNTFTAVKISNCPLPVVCLLGEVVELAARSAVILRCKHRHCFVFLLQKRLFYINEIRTTRNAAAHTALDDEFPLFRGIKG